MQRRKLTYLERNAIYDKCDACCAYCGAHIDFKDMQVDHVMPLRKGGTDSLDNMLPACRSCNFYKSTYDLEDFREQISLITSRLPREFIYKVALDYGLIQETGNEVIFYFESNRAEDV